MDAGAAPGPVLDKMRPDQPGQDQHGQHRKHTVKRKPEIEAVQDLGVIHLPEQTERDQQLEAEIGRLIHKVLIDNAPLHQQIPGNPHQKQGHDTVKTEQNTFHTTKSSRYYTHKPVRTDHLYSLWHFPLTNATFRPILDGNIKFFAAAVCCRCPKESHHYE